MAVLYGLHDSFTAMSSHMNPITVLKDTSMYWHWRNGLLMQIQVLEVDARSQQLRSRGAFTHAHEIWSIAAHPSDPKSLCTAFNKGLRCSQLLISDVSVPSSLCTPLACKTLLSFHSFLWGKKSCIIHCLLNNLLNAPILYLVLWPRAWRPLYLDDPWFELLLLNHLQLVVLPCTSVYVS